MVVCPLLYSAAPTSNKHFHHMLFPWSLCSILGRPFCRVLYPDSLPHRSTKLAEGVPCDLAHAMSRRESCSFACTFSSFVEC